MLIPKYVLKDLSVGGGSIIGKDNIEELFNHVSKHKDVEDRSLAELAPSYEIADAYLVHMLEARFVNLNPIMQQMFLKLHDIEDSEKRDFILETFTSGKQGISPGSFGPSVPVAQPGLTNRDRCPIFSPGCYTNRD
jgi:hypothetical protein